MKNTHEIGATREYAAKETNKCQKSISIKNDLVAEMNDSGKMN